MSIKPSRLGSCAVADYALTTPIYYSLPQLTVSKISGEMQHEIASYVGSGAFVEHMPSGNKIYRVALQGYGDDGLGELLLHTGFASGALRLLRIDTPQSQRIAGAFWVTHFIREMTVESLYRCEIELISHGNISLTAL